MARSKKLRKVIDVSMKNKFHVKNTTDVSEDEIAYCQEFIDIIEKEKALSSIQK